MAFRKFNQDALDAYVTLIQKKNKAETITLKDVPELPPLAQMLVGTADVIGVNKQGQEWPIMVKKVWQPSTGPGKTIEEIIKGRENFYVEKKEKGKWSVKAGTPVYFACQNIMMSLEKEGMDLVLFNERNNDIMIVGVNLDIAFCKQMADEMGVYLHNKTDFMGLVRG